MSQATDVRGHTQSGTLTGGWQAGALGGIAGGAAMVAAMIAMDAGQVYAVSIPGLYALSPPSSPFAGLAIHLTHGALFGTLFALLSSLGGFRTDLGRSLLGGLTFGVGLWAVASSLVMPVWLSAVGFPMAPSVPNFALPSLLWHAVFGVVLGLVYGTAADLF